MKPRNMICLWFDKDAEDAAGLTVRVARVQADHGHFVNSLYLPLSVPGPGSRPFSH